MLLTAAITCLALNVYHEARGEPLMGQVAVALVTMNRAADDPSKVCSVVTERKQFSWTNGLVVKINGMPLLKPAGMPTNEAAWNRALGVAQVVLSGWMIDVTHGANFYHATRVSPNWRSAMGQTKVIGKHIFYRGKYGNNK